MGRSGPAGVHRSALGLVDVRSPIFVLVARAPGAGGGPGRMAGRSPASATSVPTWSRWMTPSMRGMLLSGLVDGLPPRRGGSDRRAGAGDPVVRDRDRPGAGGPRSARAERDGRLEAVGEVGELEVPASLNALLASRLDALNPMEREVGEGDGGLRRGVPARQRRLPSPTSLTISSTRRSRGLVRKQVLVIRGGPVVAGPRAVCVRAGPCSTALVYEARGGSASSATSPPPPTLSPRVRRRRRGGGGDDRLPPSRRLSGSGQTTRMLRSCVNGRRRHCNGPRAGPRPSALPTRLSVAT